MQNTFEIACYQSQLIYNDILLTPDQQLIQMVTREKTS